MITPKYSLWIVISRGIRYSIDQCPPEGRMSDVREDVTGSLGAAGKYLNFLPRRKAPRLQSLL